MQPENSNSEPASLHDIYEADGDRRFVMGYYLSSTNTGPLLYACASLFGSQLTNVYSTTTRAEGPIPKSPRLITVDPNSVSNTVYADVIQVAYASTDRQILRLLSSASLSSSSITARPGAVSRTQPAAAPATITPNAGPSPSASSDDKGLSTGAKAGIGVAVPLGVIAVFLTGYFIWYRRRQAKKDPERGPGGHRPRFSELDQGAEKRPPPAPVELDAGETQELPGDGLRAEAEDDMAKRTNQHYLEETLQAQATRSKSREASGAFTFDRVFDTYSRQTDVFDFSIRSTVDDILNGYNGTVFAYGQTGAGKSYTMMGSDIDDNEQRGIIPRIVEQMFTSILRSPGNIEYTVRVSYMEIYMERIRDLLMPQNDNLPIHEDKSRGVYVKGLLEIYVSSVQEVLEVMRRGGASRATAATNMNQESSRSHSIFVITITQKNVETGSAKSGQLFLVDLAGSEKVGKTGASGQTLEEAKKINRSLSALGMVINSLTDGKSTHIPYRDSKLTRILQESLGGNSRTTLIINCSPSSYNDAETISTLRFGVRAKTIKNKPKINAELSPLELKQLLKKAQHQVTTYENYVANLEGEVQLWRGGETVPKERWTAALGSDTAASKLEPRAPRPATPSRLQTDLSR
ncbi:MAG: hypothetical protein Q9214_002379, partial [Letrouitia sp. 1 TL-2023]